MTMWVIGLVLLAFGGGVWLGASRWRRLATEGSRDAVGLRLLHELAEGDYEHVAAELEAICEAEPHEPAVFLALAAIDRHRGRLSRAKALHRVVLASSELEHDERVAGLVGLGRDLLTEGNVPAAAGALNRANSLAPSSPATLESLARALDRAGAWEPSATAWERLERHVSGRRARAARVGRGRALAGQALDALRLGETEKARKLAARGLELAPDSGFAWLVEARAAASAHDALVAWQRAWELAGVGAGTIVAEGMQWARENDRVAALVARLRGSLRGTAHPASVVALASELYDHDSEAAVSAWQRVADHSSEAQLALLRTAVAGLDLPGVEPALLEPGPSAFVCLACAATVDEFAFRCSHCGRWDSLCDARAPRRRTRQRLDDLPAAD
ncbi:MAG: hypothetical protein B7733_14625 [Myxococcales bacterium FL481]|nr:MAG: hypothetical protein B7733_14625 [Myxococcales bacterium FL481]